jgi:HEAT repeat protein
MFDEAVANRWILRSLKLTVAAGAVLLAGWWAMQLRGSRGPTKKSPAQQVAVVRNHSEKAFARRVAAEALEGADASIAGQLTAELSTGDPVGREVAALALGRLRAQADGAVDALIAALDGPELAVRQEATIALRRIGARPEEVAAALARSARDADSDVRCWAAIELGRIADDDDDVLEALRGGLSDPDARVRAEAQAALWRHSASRVDELIVALHDADSQVRWTACTLLGRMGDEAEPAVGDLAKLMASNDPVAWSAYEAIQSIGGQNPRIASLLVPLLDSEDVWTAERAAQLMGRLGRTTEDVRERLLAHLEDPRGDMDFLAFSSLHRTGLEAELRPPELIDELEEAGDGVRSLILHDVRMSRRHGMPSSYPTGERGYGVTDRDLARLAGLHNLRLLDLSESPVGDAALEQIAGFEQLEWLILCDTQITSAGLAHLARLTRLRSLSLGGCEITDQGLDQLQHLPALEALDLRKTPVTDAGMRSLADCKQLKSIWLDETQVTDAGLAHLAALPSLEDVGFFAKQFTLQGLAQIKGLAIARPRPETVSDDELALLAEMPRLRTLILSRSGVTDAGLAHIGKLTQLESLWLDETAITDAGLPQLRWLANLKLLYLAKTPTTEQGRAALQPSLPHLESLLVHSNVPPPTMKQPYTVVGLRPEGEPAAARMIQRVSPAISAD